MARFKDFDAASEERSGTPIAFQLGGQQWTAPHVNAGTFLAFVRKASEGGDAAVLAFDDFITHVLPDAEREPFHEMLAESNIPISTLTDLVKWIIEEATGNPTDAVSPSPPQRSRRGQRAKVVSLSGGSRPKGSRSAAG